MPAWTLEDVIALTLTELGSAFKTMGIMQEEQIERSALEAQHEEIAWAEYAQVMEEKNLQQSVIRTLKMDHLKVLAKLVLRTKKKGFKQS